MEDDAIALLSQRLLSQHSFITGSTGSGKTYCLLRLLQGELEQGSSLVLIDPKGETYDKLLACASGFGLPPERVTLIDPRRDRAPIPAWNPFLADVPLVQAVADFTEIIELTSSNWGPRIADVLANAALLCGAHGLSLAELRRILTCEEFRTNLLRRTPTRASGAAYEEAVRFFTEEFAAWGRSERAQATSAVLNKLRPYLQSDYLMSLLGGTQNTLDFSILAQRQQVILVRLDRVTLGDTCARFLGALVIHLLYHSALRQTGLVPIVLALDEVPLLERQVGGLLAEIATVARSQGIRLVAVCQHLAQLSDRLRAALLSGCGVQAFFRLGYEDARYGATAFATGVGEAVESIQITRVRSGRGRGSEATREIRLPLTNESGRPLDLPRVLCERLSDVPMPGCSVSRLIRFARLRGNPNVCVDLPDTEYPVPITKVVADLPPQSYRFQGFPLQMVVSLPAIQITPRMKRETEVTREWIRRLQGMQPRHCALRLGGAVPRQVRIDDVVIPAQNTARLASYRALCEAANGQPPSSRLAREANEEDDRTPAAAEVTAPQRPRCSEEDDGSID